MSDFASAFECIMKLPVRITPCPIVEAVMDVRFVSSEPWQVMPGLLYTAVRERYTDKKELPVAQIPEEIREQDTSLRFQALVRFQAEKMMLQLGPRVLSVIFTGGEYPGWNAFRGEMEWLLPRLKGLRFIQEVGRLGLRYIDFFEGDAMQKLQAEFVLHGEKLADREISFTTTLQRDQFRQRLHINNRSILRTDEEPKPGTVLDLDTWISGASLNLFEEGLSHFDRAHQLQKELFFELLDPEFLKTLNPEYL